MIDFLTLTTPRRLDDGRFAWAVPDGWQQGRGAFGGLTLATLVRAIEAVAGSPDRPLRTLTAELCGPTLPGEASIQVEMLREGNGVSTLTARLDQQDGVKSHVVAVLGRARGTDPGWNHVTPPSMPDWRGVTLLPAQLPMVPPFARHYAYGPTGPFPYAGQEEALSEGWLRPLDPGPARDAALLVSLADAWWPSAFSRFTGPRAMATISFMIELVSPWEGLEPEAPIFHRGRTVVSTEGYTVEFRELWGEDGRLLSLNQQMIAVIR